MTKTLSRQQKKAIKAAAKEAQTPTESPEDQERYRAHLKASHVLYEPEKEAYEEGRLNDLT